jgi:hypothetical protein
LPPEDVPDVVPDVVVEVVFEAAPAAVAVFELVSALDALPDSDGGEAQPQSSAVSTLN